MRYIGCVLVVIPSCETLILLYYYVYCTILLCLLCYTVIAIVLYCYITNPTRYYKRKL